MQSAKKISGPLSRISTPLNKMLSVLRGLMKLTRSEQRKFISTCHSDFLRYFAFCAREIVSENYKVTADQLKKLRRQKRLVKSLAQSRISLKTIRVILQTCGFLQLLLPSAIGMLSSILNKQWIEQLTRAWVKNTLISYGVPTSRNADMIESCTSITRQRWLPNPQNHSQVWRQSIRCCSTESLESPANNFEIHEMYRNLQTLLEDFFV